MLVKKLINVLGNSKGAMKPGYEIRYCTDTEKFQKSRYDTMGIR